MPWVDNYDTTKYYVVKWTMRFLAGIITLTPGFVYACLFPLIFGRVPFTVALLFDWIPIVMMNGFIFGCGLHTHLTRRLMKCCGFPNTQDNNYLSTSIGFSVI